MSEKSDRAKLEDQLDRLFMDKKDRIPRMVQMLKDLTAEVERNYDGANRNRKKAWYQAYQFILNDLY